MHTSQTSLSWDFVRRTPAYKKIICAGIVCLGILTCYVPWTYTFSGLQGIHSERAAGYHFIFYPPRPESDSRAYGVKIDVPRMVIPMVVVVCVTLAAVALAGSKTRKEAEPRA
jgi:hypothetical protein